MMPSDPHGVEEAAVAGEIIEKHRDPRGSSLLLEAAGLRWLAEAEPVGGIRVARVTGARDDVLVEERVATGPPSRAAAHRIGVGLARLHAAGAPWLGCPPPGWPLSAVEGMTPVPACRGLWVGRARTPLVARADAPLTWGAFFAEHRIRYYVRLLRDSGRFGARETALLSRVADRVSAGFFDAPQPELVRGAIARAPGVACARLHGDLWAGNVLWDASPAAPTGGVLIDPMAHGGHAETDLAMLGLFGFPFLDEVLAAYDEASPLADGWRGRVGLHQLAPLLLHCVLFGGEYVPETLSVARRYV